MAKEVGDTEFCHLRCRPHRGAFSAYLKNIWGFRGTGVLRRYAHLAEATLSQCHESISDVWCCRTVSKEPRQPRPRVLVIAFPWMIYGEFQDHVAQVSCDPSYPRSCSYAAITWCRVRKGPRFGGSQLLPRATVERISRVSGVLCRRKQHLACQSVG